MKKLIMEFADWLMEQSYYLDENGKYTNDSMEEGYMTLDNIVNQFAEEKKILFNQKPFYTANVRDVLDLQVSGEISFSRMVELLNEIVIQTQDQNCRMQVSKVICSLCGNDWIALRPDGVDKLECKHCKIISTVQRVG